jgi:D-glycero-alpha-D-manno-heptose-7-phosphate kinase
VIISRTPFRLSFMGGGTDLPSFYQEEEGMVLSTALDKYMYITVNKRFDESYRLSYSKTEICQKIEDIEHPIFRTVLKKYAPKGRGLEIISMADIPSGTGLGSSSSFTVGLLHAMKAHGGSFQSAEDLACEASRIEIEDLKEPIGKQDQYAAAYGGFNVTRFLL